MPRGKRISDDLVKVIFQTYDEGIENGVKTHGIGSYIARRLFLPIRTVNSILEKRIANTHTRTKLPLGGRKKTTQVQDRRLILDVKRRPFSQIRDFRMSSGIELSNKTIYRRLKSAGIGRYVAMKDCLSNAQRERRLQWTRVHRRRNWRRVIFSDETVVKIAKGRTHGKLYVYRKRGTKLSLRHTLSIPQVQVPGSITFWGCFSYRGFGVLHGMRSTMNSERYIETLESNLLPSIDLMDFDDGNYVFQQDNAPPHTAHATRAWFREKGIELLDWAPHSPDLNPIENVWGIIKQQLHKRNPVTVDEAHDLIIDIWNNLPLALAQRLADSMEKRCRLCLMRRGLRIPY